MGFVPVTKYWAKDPLSPKGVTPRIVSHDFDQDEKSPSRVYPVALTWWGWFSEDHDYNQFDLENFLAFLIQTIIGTCPKRM